MNRFQLLANACLRLSFSVYLYRTSACLAAVTFSGCTLCAYGLFCETVLIVVSLSLVSLIHRPLLQFSSPKGKLPTALSRLIRYLFTTAQSLLSGLQWLLAAVTFDGLQYIRMGCSILEWAVVVEWYSQLMQLDDVAILRCAGFSSCEFRMHHALSHHPYTNTVMDAELNQLLPEVSFFPQSVKVCTLLELLAHLCLSMGP